MSTARIPNDQSAKLQYFKWDDKFNKQKPYSLLMEAPEGFPKANHTREAGPLEKITDIRGREEEFTLDMHGFAVRAQNLPDMEFSRYQVEEEYFRFVRQLLHDECGPDSEIFIFDWRLRSSDEAKTSYDKNERVNVADPELILRPADVVHVDQTPDAVRRRVRHHIPDRAGELLKHKRVRIIKQVCPSVSATYIDGQANRAWQHSVWRPTSPVVEDYPLACCDGSRVNPEDMVAVDSVRRSFVGESWHVMYRDHYHWYYLSRQTRSEVLLIKMADSDETARAKHCPHTSFKIAAVSESSPPRESIEVRALVFSPQ